MFQKNPNATLCCSSTYYIHTNSTSTNTSDTNENKYKINQSYFSPVCNIFKVNYANTNENTQMKFKIKIIYKFTLTRKYLQNIQSDNYTKYTRKKINNTEV